MVTTGGTGPAPRDVTPEATEAVRLCHECRLHKHWFSPPEKLFYSSSGRPVPRAGHMPAGVHPDDARVWGADEGHQPQVSCELSAWQCRHAVSHNAYRCQCSSAFKRCLLNILECLHRTRLYKQIVCWLHAADLRHAVSACRHVPTAVLSRQTAGLRGKSLIMNLPGKPKAIRETIDEVHLRTPDLAAVLSACRACMVDLALLDVGMRHPQTCKQPCWGSDSSHRYL